MSEHAELEARRDALRDELAALDARLRGLAEVAVDGALSRLEAEVKALSEHTERLDAELLEGREQLAALRADLARVQVLGGLP